MLNPEDQRKLDDLAPQLRALVNTDSPGQADFFIVSSGFTGEWKAVELLAKDGK